MRYDGRTVVLGGAGTLTRQPDLIILAGPAGGDAAVEHTIGATAASSAAARCAALAQIIGATDHLAAVSVGSDGAVAVVGGGLQLRSDHVGYRRIQQGPVASVLRTCTALAVVPPGTGWWPDEGAQELQGGSRSGAGFWTKLEPHAGARDDVVDGVLCACGAFGHPLTLRCTACGTLVPSARHSIRQPRVVVGRLVLDDARTLALDGPVVIGREPHHSREVQQGVAFPLVLSDSQRSVSRVHAVLHLDGWDVLLEDRMSANGTAVRPSDAALWTTLDPGTSVRILPGTDIALGRRIVRLDD